MTIQVTCDNCGKVVKAKDEYAGKKGKCSGCGRIVLLPAPKIVHSEADESQFPWLNESVPAQNSRHSEADNQICNRAQPAAQQQPPALEVPPHRQQQESTGASDTNNSRMADFMDSISQQGSAETSGTSNSSGDARTCPSCAETIKAAATKCRYCGEVLVAANDEPSTQPPAFPEFRTDTGFTDRPRSFGSMNHKMRTARILISTIVILVPLTIIAVLLFGISERQEIQLILEENQRELDKLTREGEDKAKRMKEVGDMLIDEIRGKR